MSDYRDLIDRLRAVPNFNDGKLAHEAADALERMSWQPIETATVPPNTDVLVYWPIVALDDDDEPTETVTGGQRLVSRMDSSGSWDEPDCANSMGAWFCDDEEWAQQPTHWMPLPEPPR